uniref:RNase_PH domain-containing protein n=1 Tax=Steinernema glaseri TaxID=37863 RepID=A0A1I8A9Q4_9BILA
MDIVDELGYRRDGRTAEQIRNVVFRLNAFPNADGSAYLEQGNTKVLCAVYGPREPRQRSRQLEDRCFVNCQFSQALFAGTEQRRRQRGDRKANEHQRLVEKAMESVIITTNYPRCQVDIFFEVLSV